MCVEWTSEWMNQWLNKSTNELNLQKNQRLNYNYFSVVFYFVDEETEARQSHRAETHSWVGRVPNLTQELSSLGPRGMQFYCTQRRAPPESFREVWCLLQSFIALEVYLSLHCSAMVGFSLRLPCFCSDLLVHSVPVRHLRPQAERQCAGGVMNLGSEEQKRWAQVLALFGNCSYLGQVTSLLSVSAFSSIEWEWLLYLSHGVCCTDSIR